MSTHVPPSAPQEVTPLPGYCSSLLADELCTLGEKVGQGTRKGGKIKPLFVDRPIVRAVFIAHSVSASAPLLLV